VLLLQILQFGGVCSGMLSNGVRHVTDSGCNVRSQLKLPCQHKLTEKKGNEKKKEERKNAGRDRKGVV